MFGGAFGGGGGVGLKSILLIVVSSLCLFLASVGVCVCLRKSEFNVCQTVAVNSEIVVVSIELTYVRMYRVPLQ